MRVQQQQQRRTYTPEFRADTVALMHRRDCSYREVSEELGVNQYTLRRWYMADLMAKKKGKRPKDTRSASGAAPAGETPEEQIERLERENAKLLKKVERLEEDRAILKKAAAFFAKESE
jgi:transposase